MVVVELVPGRLPCTTFVKFLCEVLKVLKSSSRTWAVGEDHMIVVRPYPHINAPFAVKATRIFARDVGRGFGCLFEEGKT